VKVQDRFEGREIDEESGPSRVNGGFMRDMERNIYPMK
jgi:hypothetical protein